MSFSYSAGGTRDEAVSSLDNLDFSQAHSDKVGQGVRDLLVTHLNEADGNTDVRYDVQASGHAGTGQILSLNVTVASRWLSADEIAARDAAQAPQAPTA
jgi:hypothetical protein